MNFPHVMESLILTITTVLCSLLLLKILYNLRSFLSWRVNCWFCNNNFWVKYIERNCWTCPKCEQYNGFTKDGDYNKMLSISDEKPDTSIRLIQRTPPKNGLCKMCNINQQLKVTQLANFVPMNEKKYEDEIESYRTQLEKAYKLCSPCRNVLQIKLHKEKENLLGSKLLEARTPEKINSRKEKQSKVIQNLINGISTISASAILIIITIECHERAARHKNLSSTMNKIFEIISALLERIFSIIKIEILTTFPSSERVFEMYEKFIMDLPTMNFNLDINDMTQKLLGCFVCFMLILGHFCNINKSNYSIIIDVLWTGFIMTTMLTFHIGTDLLIMGLVKFTIILVILMVHRSMRLNTRKNITRRHVTPKKITKKSVHNLTSKHIDDEDNISLDTDDDVSLSKFGLHNMTDSSNDTTGPINKSMINGRSFTPRSESMWSKPKLNSTFCVNSMMAKSPNPLSETVFLKPSFNKYQKLCKDDSDSDLDESIGSLCISSPKKRNTKVNPVFALRKFTASPNFVAPSSPMHRSRPLISPSKLGHSTSWVAGGYWGTEGERQIFNVNGSRSSSQSSGFESQASSMNQRNVFSQPPSREESVCRDPDKTALMSDRFQNFNMSNYNNCQSHSGFAPVNSPVFPQMQYNNHVQIPQARFAQQTYVSQNVFAQQQYIPNSLFKAPGGSRLIKLPPDNSFASR